ncbi:hypothetical protein WMF31_21735 [Sorangium sp. So ce1036]|uniref:hypothetical protein n=1 Tax=Sorangium sp. So ce1036 TaxID=3133328 RepID=UPI003EFFCAC8
MTRTASPLRRALLFALSMMALGAPCCAGGGLSPASEVAGLRVLSVTADLPYALPGEDVTLRMTYADAPGDEAGRGPRPVEITWLGGCVNPPVGVDEHLGCLPQWLDTYLKVVAGTNDGEGLFHREVVTAEQSAEKNGVPDALSFTLKVPTDILASAETAETGTVFSTAYVLFAACAGATRPASAPEEAGFPLECVGEDGEVLGADDFVVGYTQVYAFKNGRRNGNPVVRGLALDDVAIAEGEDALPTVPRCGALKEDAPQGCSRPEPGDECTTFEIEALMDDSAERDDESAGLGGPAVREAIWVDYYTDGGELSRSRRLVSDTVTGFQEEREVTWTPPSEPGVVSLWAVVHDTRGGASVTRRQVRVE